MNKKTIIEKIIANKENTEAKGAESIALFGSYSMDKQNDSSDIDLLIKFRKGSKSFDNFMDLAFYLEDLLGKRIELLTTESVSPFFLSAISKDLIYVY